MSSVTPTPATGVSLKVAHNQWRLFNRFLSNRLALFLFEIDILKFHFSFWQITSQPLWKNNGIPREHPLSIQVKNAKALPGSTIIPQKDSIWFYNKSNSNYCILKIIMSLLKWNVENDHLLCEVNFFLCWSFIDLTRIRIIFLSTLLKIFPKDYIDLLTQTRQLKLTRRKETTKVYLICWKIISFLCPKHNWNQHDELKTLPKIYIHNILIKI